MRNPRFASDNAAGAHPLILDALVEASQGPALAYGADPWTERATEAVREAVGVSDAAVFFVYAGTGANVLAMRALASRVESVLCSDCAHLIGAETAAPEVVGGVQLVPVPAVHGKLTPEAVTAAMPPRLGDHRPRPAVLSLTQATERGTVYTPEELRALVAVAHDHDLRVHLDGARLMHAAAALDCSLADLTGHAGIDVVSFGGTKNGLVMGEAVVVMDPARARDVGRHRKQVTQLASKMRFISCQFEAVLRDDLWRNIARPALDTAQHLARGLEALDGVQLAAPVETNAVFAHLPVPAAHRLQERWAFELWDTTTGLVRWMTAFDTTEAEVDAFLADIASALRARD